MNVQIITIGDELLIGQVIDTNSAWIAQQLNLIGAKVDEILSVSDTRTGIESALNSSNGSEVILMTGGLGPTKDDITKKVLADYFGTSLVFSQPTWDKIERLFQRWGRSTTPAHREQCYMPENAQLLKNKMGTAPGMWFEKNGKVYVSMPGVPFEMKYLMEHEVLPRLKEHFPGKPIVHRTIRTSGEGESRIARRIEPIENNLPEHIKLAFLPGLGQVRLRLTAIGDDEATLKEEIDHWVSQIEATIPELIYGYDGEELSAAIGKILIDRNLTVSTAESCTGGFVAHKITAIPGSSAYFMGSVIAYANEVKMNQLGVSPETLKQHGAVSEQTVTEMVKGASKLLNTDIAIATSGVAGPGGGTPEKPVGTVWIAVGNQDKVKTLKITAGKNRIKNIEYSSIYALNLLRQFLMEE